MEANRYLIHLSRLSGSRYGVESLQPVFVQLIYVIFNTSFEHALSLPPLYALTAKK